jgi:hypothetical protein
LRTEVKGMFGTAGPTIGLAEGRTATEKSPGGAGPVKGDIPKGGRISLSICGEPAHFGSLELRPIFNLFRDFPVFQNFWPSRNNQSKGVKAIYHSGAEVSFFPSATPPSPEMARPRLPPGGPRSGPVAGPDNAVQAASGGRQRGRGAKSYPRAFDRTARHRPSYAPPGAGRIPMIFPNQASSGCGRHKSLISQETMAGDQQCMKQTAQPGRPRERRMAMVIGLLQWHGSRHPARLLLGIIARRPWGGHRAGMRSVLRFSEP